MKQENTTPSYILAAQITFLISTIWVLIYFTSYSWGLYGYGPSIFEIITTSVTEADSELATTALFIILSRYLMSFGILWPFLSLIISKTHASKEKRSDKEEPNRIKINNKEKLQDPDRFDDLPKL